MGFSIPNPIDVVRDVTEFTLDTGEAALNTTANVTENVVETTVDLGAAGFNLTRDAAVGAWQFQGDVSRFALDRTLDAGRGAVNLTNRGIDLAGQGIDILQAGFDRATHPGDPNPPAAQGLTFAETKGASSLAYDAELGDVYQFPDGKQWEVVDVSSSDGFTQNGFRAIALQNGDQVIVAFAGTDPTSPGDLGTDLLQAAGFAPPQYQQAAAFADKWADRAGADNVTVTGHSLGGGLAAYAAIQNDLRATTVNTAPLADSNVPENVDESKITNYHVPNEFLTSVGIVNPFDQRPGNEIVVQGEHSTLNPLSPFTNHTLGSVAPDIDLPTLVE